MMLLRRTFLAATTRGLHQRTTCKHESPIRVLTAVSTCHACFSSTTSSSSSQKDQDDALLAEIKEYNKKQRDVLQQMDLLWQLNLPIDETGTRLFRETVQSDLYQRSCPVLKLEKHQIPIGLRGDNYPELIHAVLQRASLNAKSHPWLIASMMLLKDEYSLGDDGIEGVLRWHGEHRLKVAQERIANGTLKHGDIVDRDSSNNSLSVQYHKDMRTHFGNSPPAPPGLRLKGGTHVALGFNDLLLLLTACEDMDQQSPAKVHFVGYDRSPFSVAKSSVIAQMLYMSDVTVSQIVQVWYSSFWHKDTVDPFRTACWAVLEERQSKQQSQHVPQHEVEINEYLQHWLQAQPHTAVEARQRWFHTSIRGEASSSLYTRTCSFHREMDRIALLQYFMTGEFLIDGYNEEDDLVGSVAMWKVPDHAPNDNRSDQDRVCNTLLLEDILKQQQLHPECNVMELMYKLKKRQTAKLQLLVQSAVVTMDLRYGDIKPVHDESGDDLGDEICAWQADSMSWSNLLDYFDLQELHVLASCFSDGAKTTHYGYTMNWPATVYGTSIADYNTIQQRKWILQEALGERAVNSEKESGATQLLTVPHFEHAHNLADTTLAALLQPAWIAYFRCCAEQGLADTTELVLKSQQLMYKHAWPICRSDRSIFLTWKYQ